MYFIGKFYQTAKSIVAVSGVTGSLLAIIYGTLVSGGTVFIVGGTLCLANSLFNIVEISKVSIDIKREINHLEKTITEFNKQNKMLAEHNRAGKENIKKQIQENNRLATLVTKSRQHVEKIEKLQQQILDTKNSLQNENRSLKINVDQLQTLQHQYADENSELHNTVFDLQNQIVSIEQIKDQIINENKTLHQNNDKLAEQLNKQLLIIKESKKLIKHLAQFGDHYTAFGETLGKDLDRLENTSDNLDTTVGVLQNLANNLKTKTFKQLDSNSDGVITLEEFNKGLL